MDRFEREAELVGKVLDLEDVETFRCNALLPPLEGPWLLTQSPMPVVGEDGKRLGFALTRLVWSGHTSQAGVGVEIFLAGDTAERLDLEVGKKLYVKPGNTMRWYGGEIRKDNFRGFQLKTIVMTAKEPEKFGALVERGSFLFDVGDD